MFSARRAIWRAGCRRRRITDALALVDEGNAMDAPDARLLLRATLSQNQAPSPGVLHQLMSLLRALKTSPHRRQLVLLAAGVIIVICASLVGQIRLNICHPSLGNELQERESKTELDLQRWSGRSRTAMK
jgi:hypothetical protein